MVCYVNILKFFLSLTPRPAAKIKALEASTPHLPPLHLISLPSFIFHKDNVIHPMSRSG